MTPLTDAQLLRDYARTGSERAFGELVSRHTNLVYSAALRQTGSPELAREITQDVFTDLARKAPALAAPLHDDASLGGWLYKGTRYLTLNALRDQRRRVVREQKLMHELDSTPAPDEWAAVAPVLDEAMAGLNDAEREAVVLRYFQNLDYQAVGRALGVSDDTAQKRVTRAVERLRELLAKRGVAVGASGFALLVSANSVQAAPVGLVAAVTGASLVGATGNAAAKFALIKFAVPAKIKTAFVCGIILAGAATSLLVQNSKSSPMDVFQRFVNGQEPINEAVVYRRISKADGTLINQEWVRFGFQGDTWFAQRVVPDTNNSSTWLPIYGGDVCGASLNQLWTISDKNLHLADKRFATGSVPDRVGAFTRGFMFQALALGIPVSDRENIQWHGLAFTTTVSRGSVTLGTNGRPVALNYSRSDKLPGAEVRYGYGSLTAGIPTVFTVTLNRPGADVFHFEFLSLSLGEDDSQEGYVPMMFAEPGLRRVTTVWTNSLSYTVRKNKTYPAFEREGPLPLASDAPAIETDNALITAPAKARMKRGWGVVLIGFVVADVVLLAWWFQHRNRRKP